MLCECSCRASARAALATQLWVMLHTVTRRVHATRRLRLRERASPLHSERPCATSSSRNITSPTVQSALACVKAGMHSPPTELLEARAETVAVVSEEHGNQSVTSERLSSSHCRDSCGQRHQTCLQQTFNFLGPLCTLHRWRVPISKTHENQKAHVAGHPKKTIRAVLDNVFLDARVISLGRVPQAMALKTNPSLGQCLETSLGGVILSCKRHLLTGTGWDVFGSCAFRRFWPKGPSHS